MITDDSPIITDSNGWMLLDYDAEMQRSTWGTVDEFGNPVFRVIYNVDEILEANHEARVQRGDHRVTGIGDWERVASVPVGLMQQLGIDKAASDEDDDYIRRKLNDPDLKKLKTSSLKL